MYRRFIRKWGMFFEYIGSETDFEETGVCRHFFKSELLKKWQAALDACPEMTGGTSRKAGPIRPFPGTKHGCEGVEASIFSF